MKTPSKKWYLLFFLQLAIAQLVLRTPAALVAFRRASVLVVYLFLVRCSSSLGQPLLLLQITPRKSFSPLQNSSRRQALEKVSSDGMFSDKGFISKTFGRKEAVASAVREASVRYRDPPPRPCTLAGTPRRPPRVPSSESLTSRSACSARHCRSAPQPTESAHVSSAE